MITKQDIKSFYTKEGEIDTNAQSHVYGPGKPNSQLRMNTVKEVVTEFLPGARVLEIGCAEGMYCRYMALDAKLVVGVDISWPKIIRASTQSVPGNLVFMQGDWDELPFPDNSFDLILATECIEHAMDPKELVRKLGRLAPRIIASVPIAETKLEDPLSHHTGHISAFRPETFRELFVGLDINTEVIERLFMVVEATREEDYVPSNN